MVGGPYLLPSLQRHWGPGFSPGVSSTSWVSSIPHSSRCVPVLQVVCPQLSQHSQVQPPALPFLPHAALHFLAILAHC